MSQNASHLSKALISLSNDGLAKKKSDCCRCCCIIQGWFRNQKTSSVRVIKWGHFSGQNTNAHTEPKVLKFILYFARSLKITEKVSFSIASEASNGYILSGQKLLKNGKNGPIFENLKIAVKQCYQAGQF